MADKNTEITLNEKTLSFLNSCSVEEVREILTANASKQEANEEKGEAKQIIIRLQQLILEAMQNPDKLAEYAEFDEEFINKMLAIDLEEYDNIGALDANPYIVGMLKKADKNAEYKKITGKQIVDMHTQRMNLVNKKFCDLFAVKICQNILSYFIRTKLNTDVPSAVLTNPFSAVTLYDFMKEDLLQDYEEYKYLKEAELIRQEQNLKRINDDRALQNEFNIDLNAEAFSYQDTYTAYKNSFDTKNSDLAYFDIFIKVTNLEATCSLNKATNLFSLNQFIIENGLKTDFKELKIKTEENSKLNILDTHKNAKIEELEALNDKLKQQNQKLLIANDILQDKAQIDKDEITTKELWQLLRKKAKKSIIDFYKKVKGF